MAGNVVAVGDVIPQYLAGVGALGHYRRLVAEGRRVKLSLADRTRHQRLSTIVHSANVSREVRCCSRKAQNPGVFVVIYIVNRFAAVL